MSSLDSEQNLCLRDGPCPVLSMKMFVLLLVVVVDIVVVVVADVEQNLRSRLQRKPGPETSNGFSSDGSGYVGSEPVDWTF